MRGITVCMPSPAACLKEVAKQISDRDNSVRNAALNCVVQAYNIVGEKVYKMVGNISDKDMSLLEERIKRSSRKTITKPKSEFNSTLTMTAQISPQKENSSLNRNSFNGHNNSDHHEQQQEDDLEEEESLPPVTLPQIIQEPPKEVEGPFKLDPQFMRELDNIKLQHNKPKLLEFDLDFLKEDVKIPSVSDVKAITTAVTPPKPIVLSEAMTRLNISMNKTPSPKANDATLERLIKQMASQHITTALATMAQLQEIIPQPRGNSLIDYEDDFMISLTDQLKYLQTQDPTVDNNISKIYRNLLTLIDTFYHNKTLGSRVSVPVIKEMMNAMISLLVEEKLVGVPNGDAYVRVINLLCVKIIERSDHTNTICALVKLINECISNDHSPRHVDLVMKCLWRVIKLMPNWGDDIDYDSVLLEVHYFLKKFPSSWWKTKDIDTPLRTVKTILHSSVKIKGGTIMLHLGKIPNTSESEVESYILRILKSLRITEIHQLPHPKPEIQRKPLSRANHNMLTEIFQKIGSKDETKEGLNLLYDFMQQHPEADIEPFLKKSSKFFQDYIRNGLKEIEDSRKTAKSTIVEKVGDRAQESDYTALNTDSSKSAEYWKKKLYMWNDMFENIKTGKKTTSATE
ncbi:hypothetical protein NQ315_014183 [Exocentrus adspersus]|uniref:Cytoskeleton-associated protein 5 n=1 Tax=Exocentrus adspersus TaxID=1586481 RepID=A0AAV8VAV2_9CUCU|nr:hypothetical protein NQ315_014183 [Exocentrus adspersus]